MLVKPVHAEPASGARGSTSVTAGARENGFIVTTKDNFGFLKRVLAACSVTDSAQCTASAAWASGRPTCVSVLRVVCSRPECDGIHLWCYRWFDAQLSSTLTFDDSTLVHASGKGHWPGSCEEEHTLHHDSMPSLRGRALVFSKTVFT